MSTKKIKTLAEQLPKYENKWVAVERTKSGDYVIASGDRITDVKRKADAKGKKDVVFSKVPSSKKAFLA